MNSQRIKVTLTFETTVNPDDYPDEYYPTQMVESDLESDPAAFFEEAYGKGIDVTATEVPNA